MSEKTDLRGRGSELKMGWVMEPLTAGFLHVRDNREPHRALGREGCGRAPVRRLLRQPVPGELGRGLSPA